MENPNTIIVIGASAGGVEAIRKLVAELPLDIDAAVFVTLHIGAHRSDLPWLIARAGKLPARHPEDGEPVAGGQIYVAPPDHHMLIEAGHIRLTKGPRVNWARPAIDPLFVSAAKNYGVILIGVILSGGLDDGTAGLLQVKASGGTTMVQSPSEAQSSAMPESAIANVGVDFVLAAAEIGRRLADLAFSRHLLSRRSDPVAPKAPQEKAMDGQFNLNLPVAVTCPDCGGALRQTEMGPLTQFSCHIGHVYSVEVMLAAQFLAVERFLEQAMRSLGERAELCRIMAEKEPREGALEAERGLWGLARQEALDQTTPLRDLLTRTWIHPADVHNASPR